MPDFLSGRGVIVHTYIDAVGTSAVFYCRGEFFNDGCYARECFIRHIIEIDGMFFGNEKRMPGIYRFDIKEGEKLFVRVYFCGLDNAGSNFTKKTVCIHAIIKA